MLLNIYYYGYNLFYMNKRNLQYIPTVIKYKKYNTFKKLKNYMRGTQLDFKSHICKRFGNKMLFETKS